MVLWLQDSFERAKKWVQELQRQGDWLESTDFILSIFLLRLERLDTAILI